MTYRWRGFSLRSRLNLSLLTLLISAFIACEVPGAMALEGRLRVVPVLFIPSDNSEIYEGGKIAAYKNLVRKYLTLVGRGPLQFTLGVSSNLRPCFSLSDDQRQLLRRGSPFNGPPNTGGGVVQLELAYLMQTDDYAWPFLPTLIHELGHAFGLTHSDCHGYNMNTNRSVMASDPRVWSAETFSLSVPPPVFNPEEYLMLAQNKLAFPNFNFIPALHNPRGKSLKTVDSCTFDAMGETIGKYRELPGMGFELFWDGKRVNDPETAFYSRQEARDDCTWNTRTYPRKRVTCTYNGEPFTVLPAVQASRNRSSRPGRSG